MCANRGKTQKRSDTYHRQQPTESDMYADYNNHVGHYGAGGSAGEQVKMSNGGQAEGQWFFDRPSYYVPGPWAIGYGQAPYTDPYANGGCDGFVYSQGYGNRDWGYQGQQLSDSYNHQQQHTENSNYDLASSNGYAEIGNTRQERHVDRRYPTNSGRPDSSSYTNYRRGQNHRFQQSRGYASEARQRPGMPSESTTTSPDPRASSSPTPLPRQTKPTEEYFAITQNPSSHVKDPRSARKLVVLDLNGSLLLRSAHQRRNPYADPQKMRPLRTVHRRPYLGAFTSYILHDSTKDWLDTMVWSSAQPHSVEDMVDRCFGDRKSELRAVWARDTLGLAADDYYKKTPTLKDLAKPWAELPYYSTSPLTTNSPFEESETAAPSTKHHSALSTILLDDSPRKAMLQPWNHLVIREYLQQTRNVDLKMVEWEEAKERMEKTQRDIEALERTMAEAAAKRSQVDEGVPIVQNDESGPSISLDEGKNPNPSSDLPDIAQGEATSQQIAEVSEVPVLDGVFIPNAKRKKKKLAQQAKARQAREEKQREAFAALQERQHATLADRLALAQANGQVSVDVQIPNVDADYVPTQREAEKRPAADAPVLKYDETLLAVVGVLDRLKHETNVSSWMRSGGLINTALAGSQPSTGETGDRDTSAFPSTKHDAPSRGSSPSEHASPSKKRRIEPSSTLDETAPDVHSPPAATGPTSQPNPPDVEEQAHTGVPLSAPVPGACLENEQGTSSAPTHPTPSTLSVGLWYENEAVLKYWAEQGRKTLAELGIEADSGMRTASC